MACQIHQQLNCLGQNQRNYQTPRYWPFSEGNHRLPPDSPHKGLVMQKVFPCHEASWRHLDIFASLVSSEGMAPTLQNSISNITEKTEDFCYDRKLTIFQHKCFFLGCRGCFKVQSCLWVISHTLKHALGSTHHGASLEIHYTLQIWKSMEKTDISPISLNSLALEKFGRNFRYVTFKHIWLIYINFRREIDLWFHATRPHWSRSTLLR